MSSAPCRARHVERAMSSATGSSIGTWPAAGKCRCVAPYSAASSGPGGTMLRSRPPLSTSTGQVIAAGSSSARPAAPFSTPGLSGESRAIAQSRIAGSASAYQSRRARPVPGGTGRSIGSSTRRRTASCEGPEEATSTSASQAARVAASCARMPPGEWPSSTRGRGSAARMSAIIAASSAVLRARNAASSSGGASPMPGRVSACVAKPRAAKAGLQKR